MMELAGHSSRIPLYSALYNIVRAVPRMIAPWLGGIAVGIVGYRPLMGVAVAAALTSLALLLGASGKKASLEQP